jgi:hemerythrin
MITWDDTLSTGVAEIDAQHKKLIGKYNEFYTAIINGVGREIAGDILDFLQFYAVWHFEKEETCMDEYQCPIAAINKKAHAVFLEKFTRFYEQWQAGTMDHDLMLDTYLELGNWIENHIRRVDAQLGMCVHD